MQINESDGRITCVLAGHLDTLQSQKLEAALRGRVSPSMPLTFDLQAVTYVCSAFLRVCLLTAKTVGAGQFAIRGATPPIKRVFMIAGLNALLADETALGSHPSPLASPTP